MTSTSNICCTNFDTKMLHCKYLLPREILSYKTTMRSLKNQSIMVIRSHLQKFLTFDVKNVLPFKTKLQTHNLHLQVALVLIEFVPPE